MFVMGTGCLCSKLPLWQLQEQPMLGFVLFADKTPSMYRIKQISL